MLHNCAGACGYDENCGGALQWLSSGKWCILLQTLGSTPDAGEQISGVRCHLGRGLVRTAWLWGKFEARPFFLGLHWPGPQSRSRGTRAQPGAWKALLPWSSLAHWSPSGGQDSWVHFIEDFVLWLSAWLVPASCLRLPTFLRGREGVEPTPSPGTGCNRKTASFLEMSGRWRCF